MIELSQEIIAIIMLGGILAGVLTGYPLALAIGGIAFWMGIYLFGPALTFEIFYSRSYDMLNNYVLLAVPGFVLMGAVLEHSGAAEGVFEELYVWFAGLRGGLALATIILGTIVAATVGVIAASVTLLTLTALPSMVKRGYDRSLAAGAVCAGGSLGILIPPSIMLVIYGPMANLSVGKMLLGAVIPGLFLSFCYCLYILVRCILQPQIAPPVPPGEKQVPFLVKTLRLAVAIGPLVFLILAVLGSIFLGIASPTEAAGVGSLATILLAAAHRRLNMEVMKKAAATTVKVSGMVLLIGMLASSFTGIFMRAGCDEIVARFIMSMPGSKWGAFAIIMVICFALGFFIDWLGILFIMVPIITPIGTALGFDPLWFAMMICINLQMSFMTPPFAYSIFYLRGAADPRLEVTTRHIIRGVVPYVVLIAIALVVFILWPEIILWLPNKML
ncbi:MAG: TRAP transporter large permease subunit [Deltaproteobacteria bacterium]|nr:TRAP transporter large permease subunit [Deltaproteobacteria bacterium]